MIEPQHDRPDEGEIPPDLYGHAFAVAEEYRDGRLPHVSKSWEATRASLCKELARRCPGYSEQAYQDALSQGLNDSR